MKNYIVFALGLALFNFINTSGLSQQLFVPVKGNTWIVNNTLDKIDHTGLRVWQDQETILGTFFRLNKIGFVNVSIITAYNLTNIIAQCYII